MATVLSTVPKERFDKYSVVFPPQLEVKYAFEHGSEEELAQAAAGFDYILASSVTYIRKSMIDAASNLKLIQVEGVGFDKTDIEYAAEKGIPVANNRDVNKVSVAEHSVGMMLALLKRLASVDRRMKAVKSADDFLAVQAAARKAGVFELGSQHVGIVGFGAIGREIARLLGVFGAKVSYYDAFLPPKEVEQALGVAFMTAEEIFKSCDIISMHVPVLPDTINMINDETLAMMKPNAIVVNSSRGETVDQAALARALENGIIAGAAIDTISPEPPGPDHPLLNLSDEASDRLLLTPHIAGTTDEAFSRMLRWAIANFMRVENGEKPINVVNGVK